MRKTSKVKWILLPIICSLVIIVVYFSMPHKAKNEYNKNLKAILDKMALVDIANSKAIMHGDSDSAAYVHAARQVAFAAKFKNTDAKLYTLLQNADIFSYYSGTNASKRLDTAKNYYLRVVQNARETGSKVYECKAYVGLSKLGDRYGNQYCFMKYALSADSIAALLESDTLHAISYLAIGNAFMIKNKLDTAYRYFDMAANLATNLKDSTLKREYYIGLANLYFKYQWYTEAIVNISKALAIDSSKDIRNTGHVVQDYGTLASIHNEIPGIGPQMARECYTEMLAFCNDPKNKVYYGWADDIKLEIYKTYVKEKRFDKAKAFLNDTTNKGIFNILHQFKQEYIVSWNEARYYMQQAWLEKDTLNRPKTFEKAENILVGVIKNIESIDVDDRITVQAYIEMDSVLINLKKKEQASMYMNRIVKLATRLNLNCNLAQLYQSLSKQYSKSGDYKVALQYQKNSSDSKDSITALTNEKQFDLSKLQLEKKRSEQMHIKAETEKQNKFRILYVVIPIVVIFLLGLGAWLKILKIDISVIKFLIVLSFLLAFELISHFTGDYVSAMTHEDPIFIFIANLLIGVVLGAIHSFLEGWMVKKLTEPTQ